MERRGGERPAARLLARGAAGRSTSRRWSLGISLCCECGRLIALRVWPWSGKRVVQTHGFCARCTQRLLEAMRVDATAVREP